MINWFEKSKIAEIFNEIEQIKEIALESKSKKWVPLSILKKEP